MIRGRHFPHRCPGDHCAVCAEQATLIEADFIEEFLGLDVPVRGMIGASAESGETPSAAFISTTRKGGASHD